MAGVDGFVAEEKIMTGAQLPLEFMLNALRLYQPIALDLFCQRTGLAFHTIEKTLSKAHKQGLLDYNDKQLVTTKQGKRYLNNLLGLFL